MNTENDELAADSMSILSRDTVNHCLPSPLHARTLYPIADETQRHIRAKRQQICNIIEGRDHRLLVIAGPCSIHDPLSALEYAKRLKKLESQLASYLCIVMRVYYEKPRTLNGWKGLLTDPDLTGDYNVVKGIGITRRLLIDINALNLATASEFLDPLLSQYFSDLTSWVAIGARTTESQIHRELASSLPCPVGFKNTTRGNVQVAIDALLAIQHPHYRAHVADNGEIVYSLSQGNSHAHIVLRGSTTEPNYKESSVTHISNQLRSLRLPSRVMIDCSHGNSAYNQQEQLRVIEYVCEDIKNSTPTLGVMIESNLVSGKQGLTQRPLIFGKSVTDACIGWEDTVQSLEKLAKAVQYRLNTYD